MFRFAVLLGLVAFCAAKTPVDHCCSAEDRNIIQEQWKALWKDTESSKIKIGFGTKILLALAKKHSDVAPLFKAVNFEHPESGEFSAHAMRILNAIDMGINLLKDQEALEAALDHLADQHAARPGVKAEHFKTFGEILGEALPKVLDDYNAYSWRSCFKRFLAAISAKLQA